MLEYHDLQHTGCARYRFPESEIRFKFFDVSNAVRQICVEFPGWNGENPRGYYARGNKHCQLVHRTVRRRYVACFPLDYDRLFRTRQNRVEIAKSLIESVLGPPLNCPPFGSEKCHEFVSNRQDTITLAAPFSALRMDGERPAADRPLASFDRVVNLLPGFPPVSRNCVCSAILERNDIDDLQGSSL